MSDIPLEQPFLGQPVINVTKTLDKNLALATEGGSIDSRSLHYGDMITLTFFANPETLENHPALYLQVTKPLEADDYFECLAAGGPQNWNNSRVRVFGSVPIPDTAIIYHDRVMVTHYLEMRYFDAELAQKQKSGELPLETPLGRLSLNQFKLVLQREFPDMPEEGVDRILERKYYGWTKTYSPKIANYKEPHPPLRYRWGIC